MGFVRRPRRVDRRMRQGVVERLVLDVLRSAPEPMRVKDIHAMAEAVLGEPLAVSTVKNFVAGAVQGDRPLLVRASRGQYVVSPGRGSGCR